MDTICEKCGQAYLVGEWPFCPHGTPSLQVIDDSIPGGMTIENIAKTPMTFYSKSDFQKELKARGLMQRVEHKGIQGSDKSPHTTRWT